MALPPRVPHSSRLRGALFVGGLTYIDRVDEPIWHIADREHWEDARVVGRYERSTRDAGLVEVGFIHACTPGQLGGVASLFYADYPGDLVVLDLDEAMLTALGSPVRREPGDPSDPESEQFPHIYGPIPVSAVKAVYPAGFDRDGRFFVDH